MVHKKPVPSLAEWSKRMVQEYVKSKYWNIWGYPQKNSTIILGAKTCEGLPTEICLCYTCTWVQVVIWILKIYAKDNLQFWARYQNDSSKNGHILAWTWVLAKSKQTFTFFRGQTFLKMNLQGDDDDDDDDDQTFLIAINMNLQGSHRETQRHSRTACGPSSNPKFKTILTHFMWYVPSPSFFLQSPSSHAEKLVPLARSVQGNVSLSAFFIQDRL